MGVAGAIGALGGFYLPRALAQSVSATGGISAAFVAFGSLYLACLLVTVGVYLMRSRFSRV
jgi:NNP family nitrate/nitrite transporter-like MFS transporter